MNPHSVLIRASARFQRQYACVPTERNAAAQLFPLTWNVDVLAHGRSQCLVIASEECSLFSILIPVSRTAHADSFLIPFHRRLVQLFGDISWRPPPDAAGGKFSNRTNRRVIGSQNDLLFITHELLNDVDTPISPDLIQRIEKVLNSTPMSYLDMGCPVDAISEYARKLKRSGG